MANINKTLGAGLEVSRNKLASAQVTYSRHTTAVSKRKSDSLPIINVKRKQVVQSNMHSSHTQNTFSNNALFPKR